MTAYPQWLNWLQHTGLSTVIRRSDWAVMAFEAVHLLGLALLGGAACIVALAALRRSGLRGVPLATLAQGLQPLFAAGLLLMVVSGVMITISMPFKYYLNVAFRLKMVLLVGAIPATVWLVKSGPHGASSAQRRGLALVSVLLWFGAGICGRLIGFL